MRISDETAYVTYTLFLSFFIFTLVGAGNFLVVSLAGLLLCAIGLLQGSIKVDLWILLPLILYNAISLISGYRLYGNTLAGFSSTQSVFPVVYLLSAVLDVGGRRLLKLLCALWIGIMAALGIGQFTVAAFSGTAFRLSGSMWNPNAMGAMFVLGWFAMQSCILEHSDGKPCLMKLLRGLEFITLAALALTLSMGSFLSLCIGALAMWIHGRVKPKAALQQMAEIILPVAGGVLLYVTGVYTNWPWLCVPICIFLLIGAYLQQDYCRWLGTCGWPKIAICIIGMVGACILIVLRPNAAATFAERLAMMKNGLGYLSRNPLLGIGPYQWRMMNLQDEDLYFNTWHIHNIFVHVGVELGLFALVMLIVTAIRHLTKKEDKAQRGAFFAALFHNLIDTSFFYIATVPFLVMTAAKDESKAHSVSGVTIKCIFGAFAALFIWNTIQCLR